MSNKKEGKIMNEVRNIMRLHLYSIYTERSYCVSNLRYNLLLNEKAAYST